MPRQYSVIASGYERSSTFYDILTRFTVARQTLLESAPKFGLAANRTENIRFLFIASVSTIHSPPVKTLRFHARFSKDQLDILGGSLSLTSFLQTGTAACFGSRGFRWIRCDYRGRGGVVSGAGRMR